MSHSTISVLHIDTPAMPRGSILVAALFNAAAALFRSAPAAPLTRAQEAAAVRELARRQQYTDPGFAADLYAAADRHEALDD